MKKTFIKAATAVLCASVCLLNSIDSYAKVPVDTTIESSRDCTDEYYKATKFYNVLDLDITVSDGSSGSTLTDESYSTSLTLQPGTTVTVSCDTKMHGTFIVWDSLVPEWTMDIDGTTYTYGTNGFIHEYIELPVETNSFTINIADSSELPVHDGAVYGMRIADIYAYDSADVPSYVQKWDAPSDAADILIVSSHADDEDIFFGSIPPIYSDRGKVVQVAYFENHWVYDPASKIREHEKLCGLWCAGVTNYPITSDFSDAWSETLEGAKSTISWDDAVTYAVRCIRQTHPLVVVTHAADGEYGHGQHQLTSAATEEAIKKAADSTYDISSAETYGIWNTPKFYKHMSDTNTINLDARAPLSSFNGDPAIVIARNAYLCHESQQWCWFTIDDYGPYSNTCFGLEYSTVGLDVNKDDLLENITDDNEADIRESAGKEKDVIGIYCSEDLYKLADEPYGSFKLMNDIDMTGYDWTPVSFFGTFNGNGRAILNLSVSSLGSSVKDTYDGNMKVYDTSFAGLFDVLDGATVTNLKLLGVNVSVEDASTDCFVAPLAGYIENTEIESCTIEGYAYLSVSAKMFGVGGIVGYGGASSIKNTDTDMTLVCIDNDAENRDEQFMGGAYGAGYIDFDNCNIKIDGYDSDHGYVHNGGLVGMYVFYPQGTVYQGYVSNTRTEGMITFFEDNTDRRAYCAEFWGEVMNWDFTNTNNSSDFTRNEVYDYSTDLLPHYCSNPTYSEERIVSDCSGYTYTLYTCDECGYSYKGAYEVPVHSHLSDEEIVTEATYEETGVSRRLCSDCNTYVYEVIPVKEKIVIEEVTEAADYVPASVSEDSVSANGGKSAGKIIIPAIIGIAAVGGGFVFVKSRTGNGRRRNKSKNNRRETGRNTGRRSGR